MNFDFPGNQSPLLVNSLLLSSVHLLNQANIISKLNSLRIMQDSELIKVK